MAVIIACWATVTCAALTTVALIHPWRARDILRDAALYLACLTAVAAPILTNRT